jgi:hypothetical protein
MNLVLIWVLAKFLQSVPFGDRGKHTLFFMVMLLAGGTLAGLIYSVFRHVKLVRPYVG